MFTVHVVKNMSLEKLYNDNGLKMIPLKLKQMNW